ncbi:GNAT family N-acetyltransferase [Microbacterium yannicii]|uniref:GNAT family N-acetyltransferase n=1 Tax=Microbacterium yannicii TaxID=671622 RepID=UPI0009FE83EA
MSSRSVRRDTCACGRPTTHGCTGSRSTGEPAGGIGYWKVEHDGTPAWETGWNVFPEWQGRGVARAALAAR